MVSQVSQGLYEHMYYENAQRESQSFEIAVADNNDDTVKSFELNMFLSKFIVIFCTYSANSPLFIRTGSFPPHEIVMYVTFSRKRKISAINFIQKSVDHRIDEYIRTIFSDITPPQLPSIWPEDELSMKLSIDLSRPHPGNKLSFVPNQF